MQIQKLCKGSMLQCLKPLLSLGTLVLVSQTNLLPARADAVGPAFFGPYPQPGNSVYSLKLGEGTNFISGAVDDVDGVNRVNVFVRRYSDGAYWTGNNWQYPSAVVPINFYRYPQIGNYCGYEAFDGPPASAIIAGQYYLVEVKAVDNLGNVSTYSATVIGVD